MLTNSRLVHQPHDHGRCINAALSRANNLCLEKGVRLTPTREAVLRLLWQSHQPLGAYQVQGQLSKLTGKSIAPPTVYRAIEFLSDLGLVHRLASLNAYIGCPFPNSEHSNLFMICNGCGSAAEVAHSALNDVLQNASEKAQFKLESQSIELLVAALNALKTRTKLRSLQHMAKLLVSLDKINKGFAGKLVLEDVSLQLKQGEITTLIGPNGAGKSTLVRIVLGLLKPDSGDIKRTPDLKVGYMPQKLAIDPTLPISTCRFLQLANTSHQACHEALQSVGIAHLAATPIQELSGGEVQRALLARAVLRKPNLLVLDEPVQGVDVNGQNTLYRMISDLAKTLNCGVLMVSHDLHLVMSATDKVVCLNRHICCQGHPDYVTQDPAYLDIFGQTTAPYSHHHDHDHSLHGDVLDDGRGEHCDHG